MMTNEDRTVMQQIVEQHPIEVLSYLIAQLRVEEVASRP